MPKISVVIPVYNTGSLLDRTLASVTRQTLSDLEIICVDDGSTDDSLAMLKAWEARDPRVRIIAFPENGGVSRARNAGIDAAVAPYIYFLDSDDWIDDDYLEAMYAKALETGQAVVVNANYLKEYEEAGRKPESERWGFSEPGFYPTALVQSRMLCVIWARLYRRDYLLANQIRFPVVAGGAEDIYFTGLAEVLQPRSYVFWGPYHHYWQRAGSLFHQQDNGFYYVQSYRMLYRELVARGISLDGLKLFHCGMVTIDTPEKFDLIRSYLLEAGPAILEHPDHYTVLDNLLFEAVMESPDYASYRARHHANLAVEYLRARLKHRPRISVIIPVHNTGSLLDRTLSSVARQTLRDIEILCVDDGSTDGSLAILQGWAQRDPRVRVIAFPENRGVAAARNAGFDAAAAPYVYYLDSDDWIDDDYLEAMLAKAQETGQDVVVNANYVQEWEDPDKNAPSGRFGFLQEGQEWYPATQVQTFFPPVIWARLYRRDYLQRIGVRFPDVKGGAEDIYYSGLAELLQPRSFVFRGPFHHYWQREGSLFHQKTNGFYYLQSFALLYHALRERNVPTEEIRLFYAGPMLLDTAEKFDFARAFLLEIEPQVRRHPDLYVAHDLFLLDAVCSSPDYATFLSRHNPNIALAFIRSRMKKPRNNG